jgi:putative nucleotidyltransferase with HDIG domain
VITGNSDVDTGIEAIKKGAFDYVTKPFNMNEVIHKVGKALENRKLEVAHQHCQRHLDERLAEQAKEIHEAFLRAMVTLCSTLEAKDKHSAEHSHKVTEIAVAIGKGLGLQEDEMEDLHWGGLLHDIGKIAVDPYVINKAGQLTDEEYQHVMTHPAVGANIVGSVINNSRIIEIIEHHHARYDGAGLNQKLKGEDIPLLARIVALADAYNAMISTRPYRAAWSSKAALVEIRWESGKQFDPVATEAFLRMWEAEMMPRKRKVLIADYEESTRLMVKGALGHDYTVIEATDGHEAVEATQNQEPALVLMALSMPKKDGLRACYEIRANSATRLTPVVMLTPPHQDTDEKLIRDIGADHYLTKPLNPLDLADTVGHFLRIPS